MAKIDLGRISGKTAYESAQDGGFSGTEAVFNQSLARVPNIGKVQEVTLSNTSSTIFSVSLPGIKASDSPILDVKMSGTALGMQLLQEEWAKILKAETGVDAITFTLSEPLSQSITVLVKGV